MALFKDQSIARKLTWMNLAVSATALLMACLAFLAYDQVTVRDSLIRGLSAQAEIIGANSVSAVTFNDADSAANTLSALKHSPSVLSAAIYTADGKRFAGYDQSAGEPIVSPPTLPPGQDEAHWLTSNRVLLAHSIILQGQRVGTVYIRASMQLLHDRLVQYLRIIFAVLVLCLIATLIISSAFRRALADPITSLVNTAQTVSRDKNYSVRATPATTHDELAVLIESFNEMLSQIQTRDVALQGERARLRAVVENAPVGILFAEASSGRIIFGNRQIEEILHYPTLVTPDLASYDNWPAYHPDGRRIKSHEFPLYRALKNGEVVRGEEQLVLRGDDTFVWIRSSAAPIRGKDGSIVGGVVAFNDIDEEKRAEQKLRQAYDRLAIAQSTAKISDWEWDLNTQRVTLSSQTERLHGLRPGAFDGQFDSWTNTVVPSDREKFILALRTAIATGTSVETDYRILGVDGSVCWLLSKAVVRKDETGDVTSMLGVSMDISTLKHAQEALLQSEKLAAAGRLAASISHEINNPLESITNLLFLVAGDPNLSETTRSFVAQAEQELARVSHIATQTLRFYRQSTRPTNADVPALLDSVLTLHRGRFANMQVEIVRQYRSKSSLLCFEGELRQVFTNLVGNALDAMTGKPGRLVLRTTDRVNWSNAKSGIRVTIADNGSGIPPDILMRIFEPFYSTKGNRGTGLGLWVTKEIIQKHKGEVKVRSRVGVGTVFSVFFPFDGVVADDTRSDSAIAS